MINNVTLVGRLGKDLELKYTPSGVAVATGSIAVNRPFKNQQGAQEVDWINIVIWRKPAENAAKFLKKGSLMGITGRIQVRHYENDERKRVYITEVVADNVQFLEPRKSDGYQPPTDAPPEYNSNNNNKNNDPFAGTGQIDISDDDLPF